MEEWIRRWLDGDCRRELLGEVLAELEHPMEGRLSIEELEKILTIQGWEIQDGGYGPFDDLDEAARSVWLDLRRLPFRFRFSVPLVKGSLGGADFGTFEYSGATVELTDRKVDSSKDAESAIYLEGEVHANWFTTAVRRVERLAEVVGGMAVALGLAAVEKKKFDKNHPPKPGPNLGSILLFRTDWSWPERWDPATDRVVTLHSGPEPKVELQCKCLGSA